MGDRHSLVRASIKGLFYGEIEDGEWENFRAAASGGHRNGEGTFAASIRHEAHDRAAMAGEVGGSAIVAQIAAQIAEGTACRTAAASNSAACGNVEPDITGRFQ